MAALMASLSVLVGFSSPVFKPAFARSVALGQMMNVDLNLACWPSFNRSHDMLNFAFLAPMAAKAAEMKPALPAVFKPRWWYSEERLDARAVIWSLRNRPQEWKYTYESRDMKITHVPSNHEVWISWYMDYRLEARHCGCSSRGAWQLFQTLAVGRAIRAWRRWERKQRGPDPIHAQFQSHFIR